MKFFKDLKKDLEKRMGDLSTVEHALIEKDPQGISKVLVYRRQEADGDSVIYISSDQIDPKTLEAFNDLFRAGIVSRQGIVSALIKIFKS